MEMELDAKATSSYGNISKASILAVLFIGIVVILGWILNIPLLKSFHPRLVVMTANTAVLFILTGISLQLLLTKPPAKKLTTIAVICCSLAVVLVGSLTLFEHVFGLDFHIDNFLFKSQFSRMSFGSSINFILTGLAILSMDVKSKRGWYPAQFIILIQGLISLLSLVGYIYGVKLLYQPLAFTKPMALHTAICFILACAAILLSRVERGIMVIFASKDAGGVMIRRMMPIVLIVPLVMALVFRYGMSLGLYDTAAEAALHIVAVMAIFVVLVWIIARALEKIDTKRELAEDDLKAAQLSIIQAEKMSAVGRLSGSVAHELNNPLTGVINNLQLIKMEVELKQDFKVEEFKELLGVIEESALRCKNIIRSLLDFSHASVGKLEPVSFNVIIDKITTFVGHELNLQNITIQKQLGKDLPMIMGDEQLIQQIIYNFISNAKWAIEKKSATSGGVITITTYYKAGSKSVCVDVSDTGIGIAKDNLNHIFEPFFTTKGVGEGTGLGLSISYKIIKQHNGNIEIDSQEGKGTTFKISVPAC